MPKAAIACCIGENQTIVEILHGSKPGVEIFSVEIDSTYELQMAGYLSYCHLKQKYKSKVDSKILIWSGGNTSAGGQYLIPHKEYLVFGYQNKIGQYNAFVCDQFSSEIRVNEGSNYNDKYYHINIVDEWKKIINSKYSGLKSYFINGNLVAKGIYKDGMPEGKWEYFVKQNDGYNLHSTRHYIKGRMYGLYSRNCRITNKVELEEIYRNDTIIASKFYSNGVLIHKLELIDTLGKSIRKESEYYSLPTQILKKVQFKWQTGLESVSPFYVSYALHGPNKTYWPNGTLQEAGNYEHGKKVGYWIKKDSLQNVIDSIYHPPYIPLEKGLVLYSGRLKMEFDTLNRLLNGKCKIIYNDGFHSTYNIENGILQGEMVSYAYNRIYKGNYKNDVLHSMQSIEDTLGHNLGFRYFNNGLQYGTEEERYDENQLKWIKNYKDGFLHGLSVMYNKEGREISRLIYDMGRLHGYCYHYNNKGDLMSKGEYKYNLKSGQWTEVSYKKAKIEPHYKASFYHIVTDENGVSHSYDEESYGWYLKRGKG